MAPFCKLCICLLVIALLSACKKGPENGAAPPEPEPKVYTGTPFEQELQRSLDTLSRKENYAILHSIEAIDLVSYLSGYYPGGNTFPCIFFDPEQDQLTVSASGYQQTFGCDKLEDALGAFLSALINKGYEIDGVKVDNNKYVTLDGKKMVYIEVEELFPNTDSVKEHFSDDQYSFIYSDLGGWQGFTYFSGYGISPRDYPLITALGWDDMACLRVMGEDLAHEFKFGSIEKAFDTYREYINQRRGKAKPSEDKPTEPETKPAPEPAG
ncbi:hypothetical protein ACFL4W_03135 [Planctomycetota bacterium]